MYFSTNIQILIHGLFGVLEEHVTSAQVLRLSFKDSAIYGMLSFMLILTLDNFRIQKTNRSVYVDIDFKWRLTQSDQILTVHSIMRNKLLLIFQG
jgi:hypothetical protein